MTTLFDTVKYYVMDQLINKSEGQGEWEQQLNSMTNTELIELISIALDKLQFTNNWNLDDE